MKVKCRWRSSRSKVEYDLLDLTPGGCLVDTRASVPKTEGSILIWLEGLEPLAATVVWAEDGQAGIAFDQLLHEAVFARLTEHSR